MKVLCHYNLASSLKTELQARCGAGIEMLFCPAEEPARFAELLPQVDVLWHVLRPVTAEHIASAPSLKLIQKLGTGINTIATEAARARNIAICNTPGANTQSVAEMTLLLMLAALRRLPEMMRRVRKPEDWAMPPSMQTGISDLGGKTVGLVGFGAVPSLLAPWLTAMGARVVYTSKTRKPDVAVDYLALDDLIAQSDIVSLHVPLTDDTKGLMSAARLARMKPGAILVNTARGAIVDEAALADALKDGHLGGAGLDVFVDEPTDPNNPLLALPGVTAAPHIAWLTRETLTRCFDVAFENVTLLAQGQPLRHRLV